MKQYIKYWFCLLAISYSGICQITHYNQFPTKQPTHILDEKLDNISFAYSLRLLESDYEGPLIRLRRSSDNAEEDFFCTDNDRIDIAAIDTWRNGSNVFVVTWYDQSGLSRNAIQSDINFQPQFFSDSIQPYFVGDGTNDLLIIQENFQNLVENGKNGSVFGVLYATDRSNTSFGVANGSNRWLTHINWSNERCYFDPGYCCNNPRYFTNNIPTHPTDPGSLGIWDQYSFVRRDDPANATTDRIIVRLGAIEKLNGDFPDSEFCNLTVNFGLGAAITNNMNDGTRYSTTRFAEIIMYNIGLEDSFFEEIEENQITFWNL